MGVLAALAGIARGEPLPGAARLALPPRFAPALPGAAEATEDRAATSRAAATRQAEPVAPAEGRPPSPIQRDRPTPVGSGARTAPTDVAPAGVQPYPPTAPLAGATPAPAPLPPAHPATLASRAAEPRVAAIAHSAPTPAIDRPAPPRAAAPDYRAPLGEQAVAGRIAVVREQRPVIHVTIDRIDVRASAPVTSPAPAARQRPRPSRSLAEYLAGDKPGGRA